MTQFLAKASSALIVNELDHTCLNYGHAGRCLTVCVHTGGTGTREVMYDFARPLWIIIVDSARVMRRNAVIDPPHG